MDLDQIISFVDGDTVLLEKLVNNDSFCWNKLRENLDIFNEKYHLMFNNLFRTSCFLRYNNFYIRMLNLKHFVQDYEKHRNELIKQFLTCENV